MSNKLLYGKSDLKNVVSLEANDEYLEIFIQQEDGSVKSEFIPNKFWILSDKPQGKNWVRLKGNLHYKWGAQFSTREEFNKTRSILRKKNVDTYSVYDSKELLCLIRA
jgi:hypothetical protein